MNARNGFIGVVLAGVGGQGLVTIGTLLGEAAVLEGRNACLSSTYGAEARGTFTKSDVLVGDGDGDGEIDFIEVVEPDALLCLAQQAFDRYAPRLEAEGAERTLLLYDGDLVTPSPLCRARSVGIPFARLASEQGAPGAANLAALGAVVGLTGAARPESVRAVLESRAFRKGSAEAFEEGLRAAKSAEQEASKR